MTATLWYNRIKDAVFPSYGSLRSVTPSSRANCDRSIRDDLTFSSVHRLLGPSPEVLRKGGIDTPTFKVLIADKPIFYVDTRDAPENDSLHSRWRSACRRERRSLNSPHSYNLSLRLPTKTKMWLNRDHLTLRLSPLERVFGKMTKRSGCEKFWRQQSPPEHVGQSHLSCTFVRSFEDPTASLTGIKLNDADRALVGEELCL